MKYILLLVAASTLAAEPGATTPVLEGLASRAEVTGPRGNFITEMITLRDGTARFVQIYPPDDPNRRGRVELVIDSANRAFQRDAAGKFVPAEAGTSSFVRGHDAARLANGNRPSNLSMDAPAEMGGGTVTIELGDYRRVIAFDLPFSATFVHSAAPKDRFVYRYTALLPFRIAPGSPSPSPGATTDPAALFDRLGDLGELAAAHEQIMAAHRNSDAAMLTANAAERTTNSGRGRLTEVDRDEQRARMGEYLGSIRFSRYVDTAVPVIAISGDGTLGWLACEMDAAGVHTSNGKSEPIAYGFSWVEFFARGPGDPTKRAWRAIGNASSQRP